MKGLSFILAASFLLLTSSCNMAYDYEDLELDHNVKQVVFFSDETDYNHEAPYYDAIIELKKDFPEEIDNMMVLSADKANKYYEMFQVEKCPAILVFYKDKVVVKVNGTVSKEQIIEPMAEVLSHDLNTQVH